MGLAQSRGVGGQVGIRRSLQRSGQSHWKLQQSVSFTLIMVHIQVGSLLYLWWQDLRFETIAEPTSQL